MGQIVFLTLLLQLAVVVAVMRQLPPVMVDQVVGQVELDPISKEAELLVKEMTVAGQSNITQVVAVVRAEQEAALHRHLVEMVERDTMLQLFLEQVME